MRKFAQFKPIFGTIFICFLTTSISAQSASENNVFPIAIILIIAVLVLSVIFLAADNFMQSITGAKGPDIQNRDSFFPALTKWSKPKLPDFVNEEDDYNELKQGFDILLEGEAAPKLLDFGSSRFAVQPKNFRGIAPIPKMRVEVGDEVKAGDTLFIDKNAPNVNYVAPVSGEIVAINRGAKRAISEVVILADKEIKFKSLPSLDLEQGRQALVDYLQDVGFWPFIKERPYDLVPAIDSIPENIFISTFDSAPLAPDLNFIVEGQAEAFHKGIEVLSHLTSGDVHLGLSANNNLPNTIFTENNIAKKHWFKGPHPSGNVGVQIHHIDSIGRGEKVWVLGVQDVIMLGNILLNNKFDGSRVVAITGSVDDPGYIKTFLGANMGEILKSQNTDNIRIISGDILSGAVKRKEQFLNAWDDQVTLVEEGNEYEMFGWLLPSKQRPSVSKTYPNFLFKDLKYKPDTNTHGERRAFVVTDQYEKLLPMDIYPQHLMKAILNNDFEKMEGLGIYELSEEDIALCEFACTSKMPLQKILRDGLTLMREQG